MSWAPAGQGRQEKTPSLPSRSSPCCQEDEMVVPRKVGSRLEGEERGAPQDRHEPSVGATLREGGARWGLWEGESGEAGSTALYCWASKQRTLLTTTGVLLLLKCIKRLNMTYKPSRAPQAWYFCCSRKPWRLDPSRKNRCSGTQVNLHMAPKPPFYVHPPTLHLSVCLSLIFIVWWPEVFREGSCALVLLSDWQEIRVSPPGACRAEGVGPQPCPLTCGFGFTAQRWGDCHRPPGLAGVRCIWAGARWGAAALPWNPKPFQTLGNLSTFSACEALKISLCTFFQHDVRCRFIKSDLGECLLNVDSFKTEFLFPWGFCH